MTERANVVHLWAAAFAGLVLLVVGASAGYTMGKDATPTVPPPCVEAMNAAEQVVVLSSHLMEQTVDALDAVIEDRPGVAVRIAQRLRPTAEALVAATEVFTATAERCR